MNDLDAALRATYQARSHTPEPPDLLDEVLAIPDLDSPQQRRWLPLPAGRFQSMFSATKLVVAGAIVALFGGFLLAGLLTQPSEEPVPGTATEDPSMTVSWFEVDGDDTGWPELATETDEGYLLVEHIQFGMIFAPAEPRFEGELIHTYKRLEIDDETHISVHNWIIGNDGGRWIGTGTELNGVGAPLVLDGVDGYEGLWAVWLPNEAAIFPGDAPAVPASWCQLAGDDYSAATARAEGEQLDWARDATRLLCPGVEIPE